MKQIDARRVWPFERVHGASNLDFRSVLWERETPKYPFPHNLQQLSLVPLIDGR